MNQSSFVFNEELITPKGDGNNSHLNCSNLTEVDRSFLTVFNYWVGGVASFSLTISGLVMNFATIFVLSQSSVSKKNFDRLVVALCMFDFAFLSFYLIAVLQKYFDLKVKLLVILFPKCIYPLREIVFSASIFTTIAIAHERYGAIRNPLVHHRSLKSARFRQYSKQHANLRLKYRYQKYIFSVLFCAVICNIPRFFETKVQWQNDYSKLGTITNHTQGR